MTSAKTCGAAPRLARRLGLPSLVLSLLWASGCSHSDDGERTSAIVSTASLQVKVLTNSCGANQMQDFFQIVNAGTTAVKLSDIKIKFWANDTSGQAIVPHVWTGGCVTGVNGNPSCVHPVSGVTAAATLFVPACGPDPGHQASWEITISDTDGANLPPGAIWNNVQSALNLANFSNFTPGTGTWFSPCLTGSSYASDPRFAVYYQDNLVFSNGINAPDCRAPHGTQRIVSYTPPPQSPVVGPAAGDRVLSLAVGLPLRNESILQSFIDQASDPTSTGYRKYMSAADLIANHSPTTADYNALVAWAQGRNLKAGTYPNRLIIDVTGTVAQIEQAFYANVILATRPDGSQFYRLDRQPSLDLGVALLGVSGLDNYVEPQAFAGSAPIPGTFQSSDLRGAYLGGAGSPCTTLTGSGQSIGIFSLITGFNADDISFYETKTGLTDVPAVQVQTANDPNNLPPTQAPPLAVTGNSETLELDLDIEAAIAMAPKAQIVVFEGLAADSVLQAMANNPQISQLSSSWGVGTSTLTPTTFKVMAAQGQSFFQASGDFGAYQPVTMPTATCPAATLASIAAGTSAAPPDVVPADFRAMPYTTVVGGTVLTTAAGLYTSERAWPGSSGGGIITNVGIPAYQAGANPGNAELSSVNRNLPDVSALGQSMYVIASDCNAKVPVGITGQIDKSTNTMIQPCPTANLTGRQPFSVSGTSISAPLWAGMMALINESGQPAGLGPVGFANPSFYQIGKDPTRYPTAFHDVGATIGSTAPNICGFTYNAQAGYDLTTGWGSPQCGLVSQINVRPKITVGVSGTAGGGPFICIGGQGFTPGGTVTLQYAGVPEVPNDVKVITSTLAAGSSGFLQLQDNEKVFVSQAVAAGVPACTDVETASGIVSINAVDNTTGISATTTMPASYWCATGQTAPFGTGCTIPPVTIRYSQYSACTHVPLNPGVATVDFNHAYVVFQIEGIDNSSTQAFHFNPNKLFVQQDTKDFADSKLRIYDRIFGPFAAVADTFGAGEDAEFQAAEDVSVVVATSTSDGAIEANQTPYTLSYDEQLTDPPVSFIKSNATRTSWPIEQDCCSIGLAVCN
jgi:hypothetical protein